MVPTWARQNISVSGNGRYTAEEITAACGVVEGDNLILLDKYQVAQRIYDAFPYITEVRISRSFPDGLNIEITETHAALAIETAGTWWLVSENGKVLENVEDDRTQGYLLLLGMFAPEIAAGKPLELSPDGTITAERVLELVRGLRSRDMLEKTACIDASDEKTLVLGYEDGRFEVLLGYDADFSLKLDHMKQIVDGLEPNETGIIRLTMADANEGLFIPYGR